MEKSAKLSLDTARNLYKEGGAGKLFALDNYSESELTAPVLPARWGELNTVSGWYVNEQAYVRETNRVYAADYKENKNIFPEKEQAQAVIALAQLLQLRDVYNGGVKVVQDGTKNSPCIILHTNEWVSWGYSVINTVFSFISKEVRDEFLKNFKDNLLEEVKPLYM